MAEQRRPKTTLFMLMSVDGRISTGKSDLFDFDRDIKNIPGPDNGLYQYYEAEMQTDLWSFNTGVVMNKIGVNTRQDVPVKSKVSFAIADNLPHLNEEGIKYLCSWLSRLVVYTTNPHHPAIFLDYENLSVIQKDELVFKEIFSELYSDYGVESLTVQSGSSMNSVLIRSQLIDELDLFVSPLLIGGIETPSLIGGQSFSELSDIANITSLKLKEVQVLKDSYIRLKYSVVHEEK